MGEKPILPQRPLKWVVLHPTAFTGEVLKDIAIYIMVKHCAVEADSIHAERS